MTEAAPVESVRPPRLLPGRTQDLSQAQRTALAAKAPESQGDFSFDDLIDIINPLQHLPIIGTIYRALTHDAISPVARVAGGLLYGGPIGAAAGVVGAIAEEVMGEDPGVALAERVFGTAPTQTAANPPAAASPPLAMAQIQAPAPAPAQATATAVPIPSRKPEAPAEPRTEARATAAKPIPQLSPAAFEALLQATGAVPEATASDSAAAPAGSTPRFFPAHAVGPRAPRAVPLSLPAGVATPDRNYDAAIQAMQRNLDRYKGTAAGRPATQ